jgi:hypothetical protein
MSEPRRDQVSRPPAFELDPEMENALSRAARAPCLSLSDEVRRRLRHYTDTKAAAERGHSSRGYND